MKLLEIQEKVAAALSAVEALAGIPVVVEDKGGVIARLNAAIGQATRCLLVQTPGFKPTSTASKVMVGVATVVVVAMQNIATTARGTAQDAAEIAAWELNMLPLDGVGVLVVKEISSALLDERTISYAVRLEVQTTLCDPLDNGKEEAV
jgi:hypothetical protein